MGRASPAIRTRQACCSRQSAIFFAQLPDSGVTLQAQGIVGQCQFGQAGWLARSLAEG